MYEARDVTVIGAGIVGIGCASYLQRAGHRVTVLDPDEPGENCSFGNAGAISTGSCVPQSMPGQLKYVPKWLFDPMGPLAVRWGYMPVALPWLLKFIAAGRRDRVVEIAKAMRALQIGAMDAYLPLVEAAGARDLLRRDGALFIYRSEAARAKDRLSAELRRANGIKVDELDSDELRQLEPDISPTYNCALFVEENGQCRDPFDLVQKLAEAFQRDGGTIERCRVTGFETGPDGPHRLRTDAGERDVDRLVIAAGAWSNLLVRQLGSPVPLEAERGYHTTLADPGVELRHPVSFVEAKFMATPMEMGLRLAGTAEFAGLDAEPDYRRSEMLVKQAREAFPNLRTDKPSQWMGRRPSMPDSLPVISRSPHFDNVFYAFGHGHLGLTGGAVTGKLIAEMVSGEPPSIDTTPYRIDRF